MTGIQDVVFRIPEEWDPVWFQGIIQDLFRFADARNAEGVGIEITSDADTVATYKSTTLDEAYVVTEASGELTSERILTGESNVIDITDGGAGNNVTVSVVTNGLDFEKLQQVSTSIFVGRITSGTGDIEELTATQATSLLKVFTGDSGSGGLKGLVPAPIAGDAGKYLDGDGAFTTFNIDLTSNVTGILPLTNGGTGSSSLTAGEVSQIENINSVTISNAQWVFLGDFNQALTTTSNVNFGTLTTSGAITVNDTTDSTSTTTGSIQTDGGMGIVKKLFVGGSSDFNDFMRVRSSNNSPLRVISTDAIAQMTLSDPSSSAETSNGVRVTGNVLDLFAAGATKLQIDGTTTAGDTALLIRDVDNAAVERVTVGATDSGGVGFKVLRIPN